MFKKIGDLIRKLVRFVTHDIWRIDTDAKGQKNGFLYKVIKSFILAIRNVNGQQINTHASALTYSTLLALVPMLAVMFAIARGFNFQNIVESQLFQYFRGQEAAMQTIMSLIDRSLEYAESGVFLGVGVILLLYTVIALLSKVEESFNNIWRTMRSRSFSQKFTDYLALIIIAPLLIVFNAGLSVFLNSTVDQQIIGVVVSPLIKVIPFLITIVLFTFVYIYLPNTKVKFSAALFAGIFAGVAFQLFQYVYISGQIWITKYNAIYGSFAALPLLLLWLQLTWFICLFGVQLSFAYQNVNKYSFEQETDNISRRYKDFVYLLVMTIIVKRFDSGGTAYSADQISEKLRIPTGLISTILRDLKQIGLIVETSSDPLTPAFMPASSVDELNVSNFFDRIDRAGTEDFLIDTRQEYKAEWETILALRDIPRSKESRVLLKDFRSLRGT